MKQNIIAIKLGFFLAVRSLKHASRWTTSLIVFVMILTFLNLVVVSGILVGLIQGSEVSFREKYLGDLTVSKLEKKDTVERSNEIINILQNSNLVYSFSARYDVGGQAEANYITRKSSENPNKRSIGISGIDPDREAATTKLNTNIIEGEYLTSADAGKYILVGSNLIDTYSAVGDVDTSLLRGITTGSRVKITINGNTNEYFVKGILKLKVGELSQKIFMVDSEVRKLTGKNIDEISNIAVKLNNGADNVKLKKTLLDNGFGNYAKIQTFEEGTPEFVLQMKQLFGVLGTFFGSIGIVVAAITLFIVIFINALTRRRQIGILKGIGISSNTILWSYVFQSVFYATIGSIIGLIITFGLLKPAFAAHPIDFPFSDGILVAEYSTTFLRVGILIIVSLIAGLVPAYMVVRRNTLDAILGR